MSGVVVGILSVGRYTKLTLKVSEHGFEAWCEHWPVKNNDDKKKNHISLCKMCTEV